MSVISVMVRRERTFLPRGHASRIDSCRKPLVRALRYGFAGLTVGVRVGPRGRLLLAEPASTAGSVAGNPGHAGTDRDDAAALSRLVFDPLHARVRARGRVYRAQHQPFVVVLEPAGCDTAAQILGVLDDELAGYAAILARCAAGTMLYGPVLVAVAGAPRAMLESRHTRLYFGEGTLADIDRGVPTSSVPVIGEHVAWRLGWDGRGDIPAEERHLLRTSIAAAHAEGKRVRFFGVPEKRRAVRLAFWRELHGAGADLVGAYELAALRRFLRSRRAHRRTSQDEQLVNDG